MKKAGLFEESGLKFMTSRNEGIQLFLVDDTTILNASVEN